MGHVISNVYVTCNTKFPNSSAPVYFLCTITTELNFEDSRIFTCRAATAHDTVPSGRNSQMSARPSLYVQSSACPLHKRKKIVPLNTPLNQEMGQGSRPLHIKGPYGGLRKLTFENFILHISSKFHITYYMYISYYRLHIHFILQNTLHLSDYI